MLRKDGGQVRCMFSLLAFSLSLSQFPTLNILVCFLAWSHYSESVHKLHVVHANPIVVEHVQSFWRFSPESGSRRLMGVSSSGLSRSASWESRLVRESPRSLLRLRRNEGRRSASSSSSPFSSPSGRLFLRSLFFLRPASLDRGNRRRDRWGEDSSITSTTSTTAQLWDVALSSYRFSKTMTLNVIELSSARVQFSMGKWNCLAKDHTYIHNVPLSPKCTRAAKAYLVSWVCFFCYVLEQ